MYVPTPKSRMRRTSIAIFTPRLHPEVLPRRDRDGAVFGAGCQTCTVCIRGLARRIFPCIERKTRCKRFDTIADGDEGPSEATENFSNQRLRLRAFRPRGSPAW